MRTELLKAESVGDYSCSARVAVHVRHEAGAGASATNGGREREFRRRGADS